MTWLKTKSLIAFFILLVCYSFTIAQEKQQWQQKNYARAEQNFLKGLESDNSGVRANGAYYLGEMRSKGAVGYLIHMARYDKCMACRLVAALSLLKIGDENGVQEVKMIREFTPPDTSDEKNYVLYLSLLWNQYLLAHPEDAVAMKNIQFPNEG